MRSRKEISLSDFAVPETEEVECLLLAEAISNPDTMLSLRSLISENMFSNDNTKQVWRTLCDKYDNREQIDLTTMWGSTDKTYFTKNIMSRLSQIGLDAGILEHAKVLKDTFIKRTAYFNAVRTLQMIQDGVQSDEIVGQYKEFNSDLEKEITDDSTEDIISIVNKVADSVQKNDNRKIPTGIDKLDYYTYGGFGKGKLVILAARPSVGKTTLALQMAMSASFHDKYSVVFSLEMDKLELGQKVLLTSGYLKPVEFYTNEMEWDKFESAVSKTTNDHLMINDDSFTLAEITSKISTLVRQGRCDIAYIDYLGLIEMPFGRQSKNEQVGYITRKLKQLAKQLKIPIVLLCQLNRESAREDRSPQIYDLRDSGSIEQDADVVLMLEKARTMEEGNIIDMWIRKNRGGCKDISIRLKGDEYYSNFYEYE